MKRLYLTLALAGLLGGISLPLLAQVEIKPIPVVTGYGGFNTSFEPGKQTLNPTANPIFLVPFGRRALIEAEFEMESDIEREDGKWGPAAVDKNVEYLQLDYFANRYLTVVVGRYLTPFGIFNERLHPSWVKNLQETPLIFGMTHGSGTGGMLRGGVALGRDVDLNYATYFSALSAVKLLEAERSAGGRWSLFFPHPRFEAGFSFSRRLGEEHFNIYGLDATWNVPHLPLDLRSEYARSAEGSGYWLEGAYRLIHIPTWNAFFRRSQVVVRGEQFFAPEAMSPTLPNHEEMLPDEDTQRVFFGWNYYIRDGWKLSFAYGRSFTADRDRNIWSVGIAYRFLRW